MENLETNYRAPLIINTAGRRLFVLVSAHYNIRPERLRGPERFKRVVRARHVYCYLCRQLTRLSLPQIGVTIDRDHTSVLAGARRIARIKETDLSIAQAIEHITYQFNKGAP